MTIAWDLWVDYHRTDDGIVLVCVLPGEVTDHLLLVTGRQARPAV